MGSGECSTDQPTKGDFLRCRCGCFQMNHRPFIEGGCRNCSCKTFRLGEQDEPEPPLTPEEEEQAPEDETACQDCLRGAHSPNVHREPPPPQPDRRPPYLVAYSVAGHLYEVALPGDAIVQAVDGALVIKHRLGFVAGIVHVAPLVNEESNAQADQ